MGAKLFTSFLVQTAQQVIMKAIEESGKTAEEVLAMIQRQ